MKVKAAVRTNDKVCLWWTGYKAAVRRRSNWHHDEDGVCKANASIYDRCLNVNPPRHSWRSVNANYARSNAKSSSKDANSNDGFRPIVQDGQDIFIMKSYGNLYGKLCSMENLQRAYRKARKGKGKKWYVKEFESYLHNNLFQLQKELSTMTYEPKPLKQFIIKDPKTRVISASNFRDRVVHHALCNIIEPIFEKIFIHDSYANRKNKGTHAALKRFDQFKRKVSGNGKLLPNARDNNMVYGYVLKADIKHYFDSVDHEVMMRIISRKIRDEKILHLIKEILDNHYCKTPCKGMPIGNLTSQFFANVYLNGLDYFIKHGLKAKYYIRYVDDFVIFDESKETLESYKAQINEFLKTIKLELHPQKSKVIPLHKGVNMLGFRILYNYKLPKKSNIRRIEHRIKTFIGMHGEGIMRKEEILEKINGWYAYAVHGDTYKLRRRMTGKVLKVLQTKPH